MIVRRLLRGWVAVALAATCLCATAREARADDPTKEACIQAYTGAQRLRRTGKLVAARRDLLTCAQASCPASLVGDCTAWLAEVEAVLPTVVFEVRDQSGKDRTDVRVSLDGAPLVASLDGTALPADPGEHTLRFELDGQTIERQVFLREGDLGRRVVVELPRAEGQPASAQPSLPGPTKPAPAAPARAPLQPTQTSSGGLSSPPAVTYVLFGAGLAGIATASILGVSAKADLAAMREPGTGCAPRCDAGDVDAIHTRMLVADVTLGASLVAAGLGAYLWLRDSSAPVSAPPRAGLSFGASAALDRATFVVRYEP